MLSGTPNGHRNAHYEIVPNRKPELIQDASVIAYNHWPRDVGQLAILFPTTNMNKQMDTMTARYAVPLGPNRTEVHYTYYAHQDDDAATRQHRLRQSSNMPGPSGFITLEDGAVFNRISKARGATGNNYMVMGMRLGAAPRERVAAGRERARSGSPIQHHRGSGAPPRMDAALGSPRKISRSTATLPPRAVRCFPS